SSVQWLRLTQGDVSSGACVPTQVDPNSASATNSNHCFYMDMGLKGGLAKDVDEEPIVFNDGAGASQMGAVDCDPNIPQGQVLEDGVQYGCGPSYGKNPFDWSPLCPQQNQIFTTPNPGPPWNDGRW